MEKEGQGRLRLDLRVPCLRGVVARRAAPSALEKAVE